MESIGRGVLDAPPSRGMTVATFCSPYKTSRPILLVKRIGKNLTRIVLPLRREEIVDLRVRALQLVARVIELVRQEEAALVRNRKVDQLFRRLLHAAVA